MKNVFIVFGTPITRTAWLAEYYWTAVTSSKMTSEIRQHAIPKISFKQIMQCDMYTVIGGSCQILINIIIISMIYNHDTFHSQGIAIKICIILLDLE